MMKEDYVNIGKRLPRIDGVVKATGKAKFAGNLSVFNIDDDAAPAMAHATVALYKRVVTINFHLAFYIRILKFDHLRLLRFY